MCVTSAVGAMEMTLALSSAWRGLREELWGSPSSSVRSGRENAVTGAEPGMLWSVPWRTEGADTKKHAGGEEEKKQIRRKYSE
jgi:hypothetical protein